MTKRSDPHDDALAPWLDAARADSPVADTAVPAALMARILADAAQAQPVPAPHLAQARDHGAVADFAPAPTPVEPKRRRPWHVVEDALATLGGWPALAGLAAVTAAGIWLGYSPPTALDGFAEPADASTAELLAGFDAFLLDR